MEVSAASMSAVILAIVASAFSFAVVDSLIEKRASPAASSHQLKYSLYDLADWVQGRCRCVPSHEHEGQECKLEALSHLDLL